MEPKKEELDEKEELLRELTELSDEELKKLFEGMQEDDNPNEKEEKSKLDQGYSWD